MILAGEKDYEISDDQRFLDTVQEKSYAFTHEDVRSVAHLFACAVAQSRHGQNPIVPADVQRMAEDFAALASAKILASHTGAHYKLYQAPVEVSQQQMDAYIDIATNIVIETMLEQHINC